MASRGLIASAASITRRRSPAVAVADGPRRKAGLTGSHPPSRWHASTTPSTASALTGWSQSTERSPRVTRCPRPRGPHPRPTTRCAMRSCGPARTTTTWPGSGAGPPQRKRRRVPCGIVCPMLSPTETHSATRSRWVSRCANRATSSGESRCQRHDSTEWGGAVDSESPGAPDGCVDMRCHVREAPGPSQARPASHTLLRLLVISRPSS